MLREIATVLVNGEIGDVGSRRDSSAALLLRRLSTSNHLARRRNAPDNRHVDQSPLRDAAGCAYRDRPTELATPSTTFPESQSTHLGNRPPTPKSP
jgi:hypothetical protein